MNENYLEKNTKEEEKHQVRRRKSVLLTIIINIIYLYYIQVKLFR